MSLWQRTLDIISKDIKKNVFDSWIKPIKPVNEEEDKIVLEVGNKFQKDFIENNYSSYIRSALRELTNRDISILFTISGKEPEITLPKQLPHPEPKDREKAGKVNRNVFLQKFTFDNFIIGDSNRVAHSAAQTVAHNPGTSYNPLFIFSKKGLGKTHLLHAVGNEILIHNPSANIRYVTVDDFLTDFTDSIKNQSMDHFAKKYRNTDVLLMDDINLLPGKEASQKAFLVMFNVLFLSGKQIILTSDRPPRELNETQSRLINRFEQGLVCEINSPDVETRQKILRSIADRQNFSIESHHIQYIASRITSDIRELEGAMNRLILESILLNEPLNFEYIDRVLKIYFKTKPAFQITLSGILDKAAEIYHISADQLINKRKDTAVLLPRQAAMYIAMEYSGRPVVEIAKFFGKSHSAVIHSCNKIKAHLGKDLALRNNIDRMLADLREGF
jgi:chromosomal replication initiator protein